MIDREPIKDGTGKIIGWVGTDYYGNQVLCNFSGQILGKYDVAHNVTRDFYGRKVGDGNILMMLLK